MRLLKCLGMVLLLCMTGCAMYGSGYRPGPYQEQPGYPPQSQAPPYARIPDQQVSDGFVVRDVTLTGDQESGEILAQLFEIYLSHIRTSVINRPQPGNTILIRGPSGEATLDFTADEFDTILKVVDVYQQGGDVRQHFPRQVLEYRSDQRGKKVARVDLKKVIPRQVQILNTVIGPLQKKQDRPVPAPQRSSLPESSTARSYGSASAMGTYDVIQAQDVRVKDPFPVSRIFNGRAQVIIFNDQVDPTLLASAKERAWYLTKIAGSYPQGESWYHLHTAASPRGSYPPSR